MLGYGWYYGTPKIILIAPFSQKYVQSTQTMEEFLFEPDVTSTWLILDHSQSRQNSRTKASNKKEKITLLIELCNSTN